MKIILTETQIKKIISEVTQETSVDSDAIDISKLSNKEYAKMAKTIQDYLPNTTNNTNNTSVSTNSTSQNGNTTNTSTTQLNVTGDGSNASDKKSVCIGIFKAAKAVGCCDGAAMGICANACAESGLKPNECGWDGNGKTFGVGGGLFGFYFLGKMPELMKFAYGSAGTAKMNEINNKIKNSKLPYPKVACSHANKEYIMNTLGIQFPVSYETQLKYLQSIINGKYSGIKNISDPKEAAIWWEKNYEKPAKIQDRWAKHGAKVKGYLS